MEGRPLGRLVPLRQDLKGAPWRLLLLSAGWVPKSILTKVVAVGLHPPGMSMCINPSLIKTAICVHLKKARLPG